MIQCLLDQACGVECVWIRVVLVVESSRAEDEGWKKIGQTKLALEWKSSHDVNEKYR